MQTCPCSRSVVLTLQSKNEWCGKAKNNVAVKTIVANRKVADKGLLNVNMDIAESIGQLLWRKSTALLVCARCASVNVGRQKECRVCTCYRLGGHNPKEHFIKADSRLWVMHVLLFRNLSCIPLLSVCVCKRTVSRLADHLSEWD